MRKEISEKLVNLCFGSAHPGPKTDPFRKMFQLTEEQVEEIQVLESIYADAFKRTFSSCNFIIYQLLF